MPRKPAYLLVRDRLDKMIENGIYAIGEQLPSELEMAKMFGVSRVTLRSAIKLLEEEGKIQTRHGVGTFILPPPPSIQGNLDELRSTGEMIRLAELEEGQEQLRIFTQPAELEVSAALNIEEGEEIIQLQRVRTANGEAVAYCINYFPHKLVGNLFERQQFSGSLFDFLQRHMNWYVTYAITDLEVPTLAKIPLEAWRNHPDITVLLLKQIHYTANNQPLFYANDYFRNDIFHFRLKRVRV